jgi:mannose-6-phosphate isomerase-like protein (cupin superfamily)
MNGHFFPALEVAHSFQSGRSLSDGPTHRVACARRTSAGEVEIHDREMDIFYITGGSATLVVGGTVQGVVNTGPGQWLGESIMGGRVHSLSQGDAVVIPAGVPHWFREVPEQIDYFVVKVISPA